jgi:hypothetical protein
VVWLLVTARTILLNKLNLSLLKSSSLTILVKSTTVMLPSSIVTLLTSLASDVSSVTIEDGSISVVDLTRMVKDDDLSKERLSLLRRIVLGVTSNHTTTDFLDGNVLDVETNVVTRSSLSEGFVMHLN